MALRIILVRPKEPANIGAAARAMKNFGLHELYLVAPPRKLNRQAYALASHAGDVLDEAKEVLDLDEAIQGCQLVLGTTARPRASEGFEVWTARTAVPILKAQTSAVMFGPEDFGLSNKDLDYCQGYIRIPTTDYASLNLAQAVNVIAYEWFSAGALPDTGGLELAPRETLEAMFSHLQATLNHIGYTDLNREKAALHIFRRIFDRAGLSAREVAALRGLWRQTDWAADQFPRDIPGNK